MRVTEGNWSSAGHGDLGKMTTAEAEEVIALWARLQGEREAQMEMPSTRELAEVLGASEEDVTRLLMQVRGQNAVLKPVPVVEQEKRRSKVWFWAIGFGSLIPVAFLLLFLGRSGPTVHAASHGPIMIPAPPIEIAEVGSVPFSSYAEMLPAGMTVVVDGVAVTGRDYTGAFSYDLGSNLRGQLLSEYENWSGRRALTAVEVTDGAEFRQKVLEGQPVADLVDYLRAEVQYQGKSHEVLLPVCLSTSAKARAVVDGVVSQRIAELVDWAKRS